MDAVQDAVYILERVLKRRNFTTGTRDALAERIEHIVRRELKAHGIKTKRERSAEGLDRRSMLDRRKLNT